MTENLRIMADGPIKSPSDEEAKKENELTSDEISSDVEAKRLADELGSEEEENVMNTITQAQYNNLVNKMAEEILSNGFEKTAGIKQITENVGKGLKNYWGDLSGSKVKNAARDIKNRNLENYVNSFKGMVDESDAAEWAAENLPNVLKRDLAPFKKARNKARAITGGAIGGAAALGIGGTALAKSKKKKSTEEKAAELLIGAEMQKIACANAYSEAEIYSAAGVRALEMLGVKL